MREIARRGIRLVGLVLLAAFSSSVALLGVPGEDVGRSDRDNGKEEASAKRGGPGAMGGRYIVALDESAGEDPAVQSRMVRKVEHLGGTVHHRYTAVLNGGFSATLPGRAVEALQRNPHVALLEPDQALYLDPDAPAYSDVAGSFEHAAFAGIDTDPGCCPDSWYLDRLNQRDLPLDCVSGCYSDGGGAHVYIVDTGIAYDHCDFEGMASYFWDFRSVNQGRDLNGHGTLVADVVHHVAPQASLYSVRVLNALGAGYTSDIVGGLDRVASAGNRPGVVTMAMSGGANMVMDQVVRDVIAAGFTVVVAAGNANSDACEFSPARVSEVITASSTDQDDCRSTFGNWGSCVDVYAGGTGIASAWMNAGCRTVSGTSFSAAWTAGVVAVHLGAGVCSSPARCKAKIVNDATPGLDPCPADPLLYCD